MKLQKRSFSLVFALLFAWVGNGVADKVAKLLDVGSGAPLAYQGWDTRPEMGSSMTLSSGWYVRDFNSGTAGYIRIFKSGGYPEISLNLSDWGSSDTLWVFKNWEGKIIRSATVPDFKRVFVYNPWPHSMPAISVNGSSAAAMLASGEHCGWYFALFTTLPDQVLVNFVDANFGDLYGATGMEDGAPIDVTDFLKDGEVWVTPEPLPDGTPVLYTEWPGEDGPCTFTLAMIVRDFSYTRDDFEFNTGAWNPNGTVPGSGALNNNGCGDGATKGMLRQQLSDKGKPEPVASIVCKNQKVTEWFTTIDHPSSPTGTNATCIDLPMRKTDDGMWEYDSDKDSPTRIFTPINDFNIWGDMLLIGTSAAGQVHNQNFHFCSETAADFTYRPGQVFTFSGDDDFWLFIDGELELDIGGIHPPVLERLNLDAIASYRHWEPQSKHSMKIFHCERNTDGSNFRMTTSIYFEQKKALFYDELRKSDGTIEYDVKKLTQGATNTCAGIEMTGKDGDTSVVTPSLIYVLKGGSLPTEGETLKAGKVYYGGINILSKSKFSINADKINNLSPGIYTLFVIDETQPNLMVQIKIRVQGSIRVINTEAVSQLAGRVVPVIIGNALWNAQTKEFEAAEGVEQYSLSTAGLEVYHDAAMKQKATTTVFETNEDGLDTLWVTSPRTYLENKEFRVNVFAAAGEAKPVTFVAPKLKLESSSPWTYSFVPHEMQAVLTWDSSGTKLPCDDCTGDILLFEGADLVLQNNDGNVVDHLIVGSKGITSFQVLSESDSGATGVRFTMKATIDPDLDHYAEAMVGPQDLQKPPVPVIRLAAMFDDDGDGIPDLLRMEWAENISDSLPIEFKYWFPDTATNYSLTASELKKELKSGKILNIRRDFVDTLLTDGTGQVKWAYEFEGRPLRLSRSIADSCGPVIRTAEVDISDAARDIITFRFSEKTNTESVASGTNWFMFRKGGKDRFLEYRPRSFADSGRIYSIYFLKSTGDSLKAIAGDSVRIHYAPGLDSVVLQDARRRHAHENSRLVRITGKRRIEIGSVDLVEVDVGRILDSLRQEGITDLTGGVTVVDRDKTAKDLADEYGTHGFVIPFDQLSNYIEQAGGDPDQLSLVIRMDLYTNLAGHFSTYETEIKCSDEFFDGDCTKPRLVDETRPQIYVRWFYLSKEGRMAGSGAYIASISSVVKVNGSKLSESRATQKAVWGLRRLDKEVRRR